MLNFLTKCIIINSAIFEYEWVLCLCIYIHQIISLCNLKLYYSIAQKGVLSTHFIFLPSRYTLELQESIYVFFKIA